MKSVIIASPLHHRGENRISVELSKGDVNAIGKIKSIPGRKWSRTHECWHVPATKEALRQLKEEFGKKLELRQMEKLSLQCGGQEEQPRSGPDDPGQASSGTAAQVGLEGPGFFAGIQPQFRTIHKFGEARRIVLLSKKEVEKLIQAVDNVKHKSLLLLVYSAGLRKSEVLNLRVRDLDFDRECIFVKDSKGGKDRYTLFAPEAMAFLKEYIRKYKPRYWLFEGQTGGQYSESSLQSIYERAKERGGVNPFVTLHGLRHSFATHLVEQGAALHEVKELLGHENIKTTEIYLHLAKGFFRKIRSPLEGLDL